MLGSLIRGCVPALCAVSFAVGCSSGPTPSDAVWVRWTGQTTHEDAEEKPTLTVCGHACAEGDSALGVNAPVDVEMMGDGSLRVVVPVEAGGTVRRVMSRELVVGRWPYGGSKSEVSHWVKDGEPLPQGLDEAPGAKPTAVSAAEADDRKGPVATLAAGSRPAPGTAWVPIDRALPVTASLELRRQASAEGAPRITKQSSIVVQDGKGVLEFEIPASELEAAFPNRGRDPQAATSSSPRFELFVRVTCASAPPVSSTIRRQPVLTDRDLFPSMARAGE
jgi:hypothetical protein